MPTRALVVGVEHYANPRNNLPGLSNDISAFMSILKKFDIDNIEVLRDKNAKSENMRNALEALVEDAQPGDIRIFYFTGHGVRLPEGFSGSDDSDGTDEALVPYEGTTDSLILDNWMATFLQTKLPKEAFFYAIYDCCFSGNQYKFADVVGLDPRPLEKGLDFNRLVFTGSPFRFNNNPDFSLKSLVLDDTLSNSVHIGAAEPDKTALVLDIDGTRRSVFTWALEQSVKKDVTLSQLENMVTEKQASKTAHHSPVFAMSEKNKSRKLFS